MTAPLRRNGRLITDIVKGCERKHRHPDEFVARAAGQARQEQSGVKLYVYLCEICRGWHLTKNWNGPQSAVDYYTKGSV